MHRKLLPCAAEVGRRAIPRGNFDFHTLLRSSGAAGIRNMAVRSPLGGRHGSLPVGFFSPTSLLIPLQFSICSRLPVCGV